MSSPPASSSAGTATQSPPNGVADDLTPGRSDLAVIGRLWSVIRDHQKLIWIGFALLLVNAGCRLAQPYLVLLAIDRNLTTGQLDGFLTLVLAFLGVALLEAVCRRWQLLTLERAGQRSLLDLRKRVFSHLQRLPSSHLDRTPIGRLLGRVTTDIEALQEVFSSGLVTILGDLVFLVAAVLILLSLNVSLTLATLAVVPILLIVTIAIRRRVRSSYSSMRSRLSQLNSVLHEQVSGMEVVQLFGQEARYSGVFNEVNRGVRDAQLGTVRWESILSASTELLASFTTAAILWFGGLSALESVGGGITLGVLFAFVDYMQKFFVPLNDLSLKYTVLQNALVAGDRIFALLDVPAEVPDIADPLQPSGAGAIEFRDVRFSYDEDNPVLRGLSFRVEPGERVAIVGATGAGKTTILSLITRLYEIQSGSILLDGVDIRNVGRTSLRQLIGVVPQDVFLFQGTILDNIRLGHPDIDDDATIEAATRLHLDDVVRRFPGGFREPVSERGRNLSAGEKQLIAFARMLVVAPRVLALDEATSNVDTLTEHLLQDAIQEVMRGRTALIIAHRLSTIRDVDRILVFDQGELVESGSHLQLLNRRGAYFRLYEKQFADQES